MAKKKAEKKETSSQINKIDAVKDLVVKQHGKDSIRRMGDVKDVTAVPTISTGSILLDLGLGCGGFPKGRIGEIYGPEASGKTTLTLHLAAECQKAGGVVAFIDAEHALDVGYAKAIGVNIDDLLLSQPDSGEQALDIVETIVNSGEVDLVVVDSVSALVPKAELDGEMGDSHMALQARMMSKALRKLTPSANRNGCSIVFINQIRMKIGVMFGSPETTSGGQALKYAASVRLDVRRRKSKSGDDTKRGIMNVKIVKNKLAVPFKSCEVPIVFGKGIDLLEEAYMISKELAGVFEVRGGTHYYKGEEVSLSDGTSIANDPDNISNKFATSRDKAFKFIEDNPAFFEKVVEQVRSFLDGAVTEEVSTEE